jgi:DNA-directed RNA polymerase subunit RPC12/RpoP
VSPKKKKKKKKGSLGCKSCTQMILLKPRKTMGNNLFWTRKEEEFG